MPKICLKSTKKSRSCRGLTVRLGIKLQNITWCRASDFLLLSAEQLSILLPWTGSEFYMIWPSDDGRILCVELSVHLMFQSRLLIAEHALTLVTLVNCHSHYLINNFELTVDLRSWNVSSSLRCRYEHKNAGFSQILPPTGNRCFVSQNHSLMEP